VIEASGDLLERLPLTAALAVLSVGRGSYYRAKQRSGSEAAAGAERTEEEQVLLGAIEAVVLEFPGYGYPRVTRHLQRVGWEVNHKRVRRLMGEAGLLQPKVRRSVWTTNSDHGLPIYPNLLLGCGWRQLTRPDEAWAADITYVRLLSGFCYLAVLLDLFSRRVVGWNLSESLEGKGALDALEIALSRRQPGPGWIHHSDRGVQYACRPYVQRLEAAGARISMSRVGAPRENAVAERFIRTVKEEEVNLQEYGSIGEARQGIGCFIEAVYDQKRLHSALGYRPPSEFEELFAAGVIH
jgi:putative transposase